ncbi:hypothetical protein BSNK01_14580 [Bacillaceae bacterium]
MSTPSYRCPQCGNALFGHYAFEVRCYFCGKYFYINATSTADLRERLLAQVPRYAPEYIPQEVRDYLEKSDLSQSGPVILRWYRQQEHKAAEQIGKFLRERLDERTLERLLNAYDGRVPLLPFVLESLDYPVKRTPLAPSGGGDSFDF